MVAEGKASCYHSREIEKVSPTGLSTKDQEIQKLIEPLLASKECKLAFIDRMGGRLCVAIEQKDNTPPSLGVCAAMHRPIRYALEQAGLLSPKASLEVGSPGLDRPLLTDEDYDRFKGCLVMIILHAPLEGRKRFEGKLAGHTPEALSVYVEDEDAERVFERALVCRCKLVPVL